MNSGRVVGIIPARRGSKGLPRKNVRLLEGKSLIQRAFESACEAGVLDRIILSSNDPAAETIARDIGLEVPFCRPESLAGDDAPMLGVLLHAVEELSRRGAAPDAVLLLQPTSPLRTADHIRRAVAALPGHDAVCSVTPVPRHLCPHYVMRVTDDGLLDNFLPDGARYTRRQDVPPAYYRDGTIYLTRCDVLREQRTLYGRRCFPLVLSPEETLSIDDEADWRECERRLRERSPAETGLRDSQLLTRGRVA